MNSAKVYLRWIAALLLLSTAMQLRAQEPGAHEVVRAATDEVMAVVLSLIHI